MPHWWDPEFLFCVMAIANESAIYPIVVAQALRPSLEATGRAAAPTEIRCSGVMFHENGFTGGFMAHQRKI